MKEILDSQFEKDELPAKPLRPLISNAILYLIIMFIAGFVYSSFFPNPNLDPIIGGISGSIQLILTTLLVTLIVEGIRWVYKSVKNKEIKLENPFWFELIENMMAWWILLVGLNFLNFYILS